MVLRARDVGRSSLKGEAVGIKLTWSDGRADLARLEFYDGGTYINGDRYYVTADNPNC